jgi:hypothetical protein
MFLGAWRAPDTDTIEALADPQVRSGRENTEDQDHDQEYDGGGDAEDVLEGGRDGTAALSRSAAGIAAPGSSPRPPTGLAGRPQLLVLPRPTGRGTGVLLPHRWDLPTRGRGGRRRKRSCTAECSLATVTPSGQAASCSGRTIPSSSSSATRWAGSVPAA